MNRIVKNSSKQYARVGKIYTKDMLLVKDSLYTAQKPQISNNLKK